jgi:hypothetical protein
MMKKNKRFFVPTISVFLVVTLFNLLTAGTMSEFGCGCGCEIPAQIASGTPVTIALQ